MDDHLPAMLSMKDVGKLLNLPRATTYRCLKQPGFPAIRVGKRKIIVPRTELMIWLESRKNT